MRPTTDRQWFLVVGLFLLALHLVKASYFFAMGQAPLFHDSLEYWQLASQLVDGDWLLQTDAVMHRPPGYPLFLFPFQALFGGRAMAMAAAAQQLMVVATSLLAAWACWRISGTKTGFLLTLALSLLCVQRHYLAQQMMSDTLLSLLLMALVAVLIQWSRSPMVPLSAAIGLLLGFSMLVKPLAQVLWLPVMAGMAWHLFRTDRPRERGARTLFSQGLRHLAPVMLGMILLVSPWLVRNRIVFGEYFLAKFSGRVFWGSAFDHSAANLPFPDAPRTRDIFAALRQSTVDPINAFGVYKVLISRSYTKVAAENLMLSAAGEAISANPWRFAQSVGARFFSFWTATRGTGLWRSVYWFREKRGSYLDQRPLESDAAVIFHGKGWRARPLLYTISTVAALLSSLLLLTRRQQRWPVLMIIMLAFAMSGGVALTVVPIYRFRMVLEPLLLLLFSASAGRISWRRPAKLLPIPFSGRIDSRER